MPLPRSSRPTRRLSRSLSSARRVRRPLLEQLETRRLLAGAITGRIWYDNNVNGLQDANETTNANGVVVQLIKNGNIVGQGTTANGIYTISNITAGGGYYLQFTMPTGYTLGPRDAFFDNDAADNDFDTPTAFGVTATCPSAFITVNDGETLDFDAGLAQGARLTVFAWDDGDNPNGLQDATTSEQAGLTSATITLKSSTYAYESKLTGANGIADFTNIRPGTFTLTGVRFPYSLTLQNAGSDTVDSDGDANGDVTSFTLSPGQTRTDIDFGFVEEAIATGNITGHAWLDNGDGVRQAGETALDAVLQYNLYKSTDGVVGNGDDTFVTSDVTDGNDDYQFSGLAPGNYYVRAEPETGYKLTLQNQGNDAVDSDFNPTTNFTAMLAVTAGNTVSNVDAGYLPGSGTIGDLIWNDADADGIKDAGESGLANASVKLYTSTSLLIGTVITDNSGAYSFTGLDAGSYFIRVSPPLGYLASPKDQTTDTSDSDVNPATLETITFTLAEGETQLKWDAGFYLGATIGNRVWKDNTPANGIQDAGEPGLANASLRLYNASQQLVAVTQSDANGNYSFKGIATGQYYLSVTPPTGYLIGPRDVSNNTQDTVDNDFDPVQTTTILFNVTRGVTYNQWDAGLYLGAKVGDKVWIDQNGDGRQTGEQGKAGVTVRLKRPGPDGVPGTADDQLVQSTATNASGSYTFQGVANGWYYVEFVRPTGFVFTSRNVGDDAGDSDAGLLNGRTHGFSVAGLVNNLTLDAGLMEGTTIQTKVRKDIEGDGVIHPGSPVPGVEVIIFDPGSNLVQGDFDDKEIRRGTTGPGGDLLLDNIGPGTYYVRVIQPSGYGFSPPGRGGDPSLDSDVIYFCSGYGNTYQFTLNPGDDAIATVGLVPLSGSIQGTVWNDENRNKVRDGGLIKGNNPDVILAIDISGSTTEPFAGTTVGDVNGDGFANTILDAEIQAGIALTQQLINAGLAGKTRIGIVTFNGSAQKLDMNPLTAGVQLAAYANADADGNGTKDVITTLKSIRAGGATNYEAALQAVISELQTLGTTSGNGNLIFLSDGVPTSGGTFTDEVSTLTGMKANLRAFGVGAAAPLDQLKKIDAAAAIYNTGADLLAALKLNNSAKYAGERGQAGVRVYLDLNNDGTWQSASEPSLLTAADDPDTGSIDEAGTFTFSHLAPGTYTVREAAPSGYTQTLPGSSAGNRYTVSVVGGKTVVHVDFGNAAAPSITGVPASISYTAGSAAKVLASAAVVKDLDTPILNGGQLSTRVKTNANASDVLAISHQGTAAGQIGVSGNTVTYGNVAIGTFAGGTGSTSLVITLNGSATLAAVQALARRITFRNTLASPPTAARTIEWKLTDGRGGTSALVNETVNIA